MDTPQSLQQAISAVLAGRKQEACTLLSRIVQAEPGHEQAWLWLSMALNDKEQQRHCLHRVLEIDPTNQAAREALDELGAPAAPGAVPPPPVREEAPQRGHDGPPPASSDAAGPRTPSTRWLVRGCSMFIVANLVVVVLAAILGPSLHRRREATRTATDAAFEQHMAEYLREFPAASEPVAYLDGKVLIVDARQGTVHDLTYELPKDLRATTPEEVGTIVRLDCPSEEVDYYEHGAYVAFRDRCDVEIVDRVASTLIATRTFSCPALAAEGDGPAGQSNAAQSTALDEAVILAWVVGLPPIADPGVDRVGFCTAGVLARFQSIEFDADQTLADVGLSYLSGLVENRCVEAGRSGEECAGPVPPPGTEWIIRPGPVGCDLLLRAEIEGEEETYPVFVVALPAEEVYAATSCTSSYLQAFYDRADRITYRPRRLPVRLP